MGAVYEAIDPLIERRVAVKTINLAVKLSKQEREEFEARFFREAKSAGRLNHPNIVTIYDVGEVDDIAYIAMEYLEGQTLRELLDSGVVLPIETIAGIAKRIAHGLHYAHENHVVHRDVKPANIMVTPARDVKIMDFGIAQMPTGSRTQLGTVLGSPKYMAPEQVAGQPTDRRTDIFALGVVLYEMLTGVAPFNGDNLSAIMYRVLNEEPTPPSTVNARVPPGFDAILRRALAKRPEDRYPNALEMAADLADYDSGLPLDVRKAATGKHAAMPVARVAGDEATVFLPRHRVPALAAPAFAQWLTAHFAWPPTARRPLLVAVPLMLLAAYLIVGRGTPPAPVPSGAGLLDTTPQAAPSAGLFEPRPASQPASVSQPEIPAQRPVAPEERTSPSPAPASVAQTPVAPASRAPTAAAAPVVADARPAKQAGQGSGSLIFALAPWGEIYVNGKKVGVSPPLTRVRVEPGTHRLEIRNRGFAPYRRTVTLKEGQSIKIRHKFE